MSASGADTETAQRHQHLSNYMLVNVIIVSVALAPLLAGSHTDLKGPTHELYFLETLHRAL